MGKFKCNRCSYETNNKRDFNNHINRVIPCNPNRIHKLTKKEKITYCEICDRDFSREDCLARHNKIFHANISGDNNINVSGDYNNINSPNSININNSPNSIIIQPVINIHNYTHNDIDDLTLFEQYLCLTSKSSPYAELLNHLNLNPNKPQYQNMKITNINKKYMDVNDGQKWIKEIILDAVSNIVDSKRIMIQLIFDRFRCFLSNKATYFVPKSIYYGLRQNFFFYKKVVQHVKLHLYNNRNIESKTDNDIPDDRNDKIFWALSKNFTWLEVNAYITKMDKLNIDFDDNLDGIKSSILNKCENKPKLKKFFKKLLKRIDYLIELFHTSNDEDTIESSSNDKSDQSNDDDENNNDENNKDQNHQYDD